MTTQQPGDVVERRMIDKAVDLEAALVLAQSTCIAWEHVFGSIEAHIMDRIAMGDAANPERYLGIIRNAVAEVNRTSEQISKARWADYSRHKEAEERLEAELTRLRAQPDAAAMREAVLSVVAKAAKEYRAEQQKQRAGNLGWHYYDGAADSAEMLGRLLVRALPLPPAAENDGG